MSPRRRGLRSAAFLVAFLLARPTISHAQTPELEIEVVARQFLDAPDGRPQGLQRGPGGRIFMLAPKQGLLYRFSAAKSAPVTHRLAEVIPEFHYAGVHIFQDFSVDGAGRVLIPLQWRGAGRSPVAAVFILEPDAAKGKTVALSPRVEIRHVAAGADGTFYVLGLNTDYFRGLDKECTLVHKYSPKGDRLASFSACPKTPRSASLSSVVHRLNKDIDLGHLWTSGDLVYHVLPSSRELRIFGSDGTLVRRVALQPPAENPLPARYSMFGGAPGTQEVWRIAPVPNGNFLIHWVYSHHESPGRRNLPYLALHNADGAAISQPRLLPWKRSALAFSDDEGYCYFIRWVSPERHELIRAKVDLR